MKALTWGKAGKSWLKDVSNPRKTDSMNWLRSVGPVQGASAVGARFVDGAASSLFLPLLVRFAIQITYSLCIPKEQVYLKLWYSGVSMLEYEEPPANMKNIRLSRVKTARFGSCAFIGYWRSEIFGLLSGRSGSTMQRTYT